MATQKAIVLREDGLFAVSDHPVPLRKAGELLVKLVSSSINPVDVKIIEGGNYRPKHFPKVLGGDVAGLVAEADANSKFKKGDAVYALTYGFWTETADGSYAEYAVVPEADAVAVPSKLPLDIAGGVPLVALTAWQALAPAELKPGDRVLILGASGGVGHFAVQFAKALGYYVVAVAGPANQEYLSKDLQADEVINYREQKIEEVFKDKPFDLAFDLVGGEEGKAVYQLLNPGGYYAHIFNTGSDHEFLAKIKAAAESKQGPRVGTTLVTPSGEQLQAISQLIDEGKVKLTVHRTIPLELDAVKEVHQQLQSGSGIRGKVVIQISKPE